jgi:hypothetical protein
MTSLQASHVLPETYIGSQQIYSPKLLPALEPFKKPNRPFFGNTGVFSPSPLALPVRLGVKLLKLVKLLFDRFLFPIMPSTGGGLKSSSSSTSAPPPILAPDVRMLSVSCVSVRSSPKSDSEPRSPKSLSEPRADENDGLG